jgi:four helix bundle protein
MSESRTSKAYDLEDRTFAFARDVRALVKTLPRTLANTEDSRQIIRASGSVAGNHIEANEALSKKDFIMRIKICRKESKECRLWLRLLDVGEDQRQEDTRNHLAQESQELMNIFGAILRKSE